jgi:sugar lactone lactonase YvrE
VRSHRFLIAIILSGLASAAQAQWTNGQAADLVLGQSMFTTNTPGMGPSGMYAPTDVEIDPWTGKLFVADIANNRVLRWPNVTALFSGMPAEAVLGQTNFDSVSAAAAPNRMNFPTAIAIDAEGRLWVADARNNRVLRFDNAGAKPTGADADGVLGQPDFISTMSFLSRNGMEYPRGIATDAKGTLYVSDQWNNRVLRFDGAAAKPNGANADGVLGQPDFTTDTALVSRSGMNTPRGLVVDREGRLYVAVSFNNCVLRFDNAASKSNGADADAILGQATFTSSAAGAGRNGMKEPIGLDLDATGRLYVGEEGNRRVTWFDNAANKANGADADGVIGQPDFTTTAASLTQSGLNDTWGVKIDNARGTLWVADGSANRVLRYSAAAPFAYPPAPFLLSYQGWSNPSLYRMDHTGACPAGRLVNDQPLFLRWRPAKWAAPNDARNNPSDTTRYELSMIIDSVGANSSKTITVPFPAGTGSSAMDPHIIIPATEVYEKIFRPPHPWPMEPDTLVMRVNWYVRAFNSIGSTFSDTAGHTIRNNPIPTPPLVLSYNRPPYNPPTPLAPINNAIIKNCSPTSPPLDIVWTWSSDRNIEIGARTSVFKVYDVASTGWINDRSGRTVDTLTCQWVGVVVHTAPPGTGATVGTVLVRNTGTVAGFQLLNNEYGQLLGGYTVPSPTAADTVVIDWRVNVKDFNTYGDFNVQEEVTFRYHPDGTLEADTSLYSRFGCRPHDLVSNVFRFTLVRGRSTGVPELARNGAAFSLSQNYPNPFGSASPSHASRTVIGFTLDRQMSVTLTVHDMLGREKLTLLRNAVMTGAHRIPFDGDGLPGGSYVVTMTTRDGNDQMTSSSRMMTLMK